MSTLVFIDTNIFLDFYRIDVLEAGLSILDHIKLNHNLMITSSQVEMEFYKNRQKVIIDELQEELEKVLISRFQFPVEILTIERFRNAEGQRLYRFEPFLQDILVPEKEVKRVGLPPLDPSELDTIVVPAREDGFKRDFSRGESLVRYSNS